MNNNTQQVNEDYKFRMTYVISTIRDMFATSKETDEAEVENKIRVVEENEDTKYIEGLEKAINTHEAEKINKKATRKSRVTKNIVEITMSENVIEGRNIELDKDEDSDLYR